MMRYFTADTHYAHANICRGTSRWPAGKPVIRPHDTLEEMNSAIVDAINATVGEDDELYHLGDWSFDGAERVSEMRDRVRCRNVHLVLGNHDKHIRAADPRFASVSSYAELDVGWTTLVLMHYPIETWRSKSKGFVHLHGHVHTMGGPVTGSMRMDVGIDPTRATLGWIMHQTYAPWSEQEIRQLLFAP